MKKHLLPLVFVGIMPVLSGCNFVKLLEEQIELTYSVDGEVFKKETINQFRNSLCPELPDSYIPSDCRFFGWTALNPNTVKYTDPDFKKKYCDGIVHYMDVRDHVRSGQVLMQPLIIPEDEIPKINYYCVIGWYAKTTTSGITEAMMTNWTAGLKTYLASEGVSQEELDMIDIRGYAGDVATMGAAVNKDRDVDVLLGVGNNITSQGNVATVERTENNIHMGGKTNRVIARLTEKEGAIKVYNWSITEASLAYFK